MEAVLLVNMKGENQRTPLCNTHTFGFHPRNTTIHVELQSNIQFDLLLMKQSTIDETVWKWYYWLL